MHTLRFIQKVFVSEIQFVQTQISYMNKFKQGEDEIHRTANSLIIQNF